MSRYSIERRLARGGMAEVFLARLVGPSNFSKEVVLKRMLPHLADDPEFVALFLREARTAATLSHPHIAQVFDFGQDDDGPFMVMEYVDGPSLRALIKQWKARGQPLDEPRAAHLAAQVSEALDFAHRRGVVHRDVSPENILLSREGVAKVVDFGIARVASESRVTKTGVVRGKLAYMSPEQLNDSGLDGRADLFSLGAVLYELLTLKRPRESESDVALMERILNGAHQPLRALRPDVSPLLEEVVERALQRDKVLRFQSGREFREALERASPAAAGAFVPSPGLRGLVEPEVATPPPTPSRETAVLSPPPVATAPRPVRRAPPVLVLAGLMTAAVVTALAVNERAAPSLEPEALPQTPPVRINPRLVPSPSQPTSARPHAPVTPVVRPRPADAAGHILTLHVDQGTRVFVDGRLVGRGPQVEVRAAGLVMVKLIGPNDEEETQLVEVQKNRSFEHHFGKED